MPSGTTFARHLDLPASPEDVYAWHARPGALERLTPPWESVRVLEQTGGIEPGGRVVLETRLGPVRQRWTAEHVAIDQPHSFRDVQRAGPFAAWDHSHRITARPGGSRLEDFIEYRLPFGTIGRLLAGGFVARKLDRLFAYRHRTTQEDLRMTATTTTTAAKSYLVTGATGLVGSNLVPLLSTHGHEVRRLRRGDGGAAEDPRWDPAKGTLSVAGLEGTTGIVHLAGENIAGGRWTDAQKARIRNSRVEGTRLLAESIAKMKHKPEVLVCASAIGYYGDRGSEWLDESSAAGSDFLAEVCQEWEAAAQPARDAGVRTVHMRFGVILSPAGGALAKMLTPFKLGAGGVLGNGEQYMSWIAIDDVAYAIQRALTDESLSGAVNVVAPNPVTNREFTKTLGSVLHRPTVLPMPAFAAKLAFGEMADALLLASQRVRPGRLLANGFEFAHPELEGALRHVLGK